MDNSIPIGIWAKSQAKIIGEKLFRLRKERKLSRKEIAEYMSVNVNTIAKYERGERLPPIDKLSLLAAFLKVSVSSLIGENQYSPDFIDTEKIIFEYRLRRVLNLLNSDSMLYLPTTLSDGGVIISVPVEIENGDNGTRIFKQGSNTVKFQNTKDFVDVVERAIQRTVTDNLTFNQALRQIIFT